MPTSPKTFKGRKHRSAIRGTKQQRGYGGEWERISKLKRRADPLCQVCRVAAADDVDHLVPFRGPSDPLRTDWDNLQSICRPCHMKKHGRQVRG